MDENLSNKVPPALPWHRGLLYALFITLIFLAGLEILCRQFFSSFHQAPFERQLEAPAGSVMMTFTLNEHHPAFQVPKPKSRFRVMFFGESALEGFLGRGFPAWFQALVEATHPPRTIEALNFGVGGTTSTAIREWFFPALEMEPDLLVLYIGNNELDFTSVINATDHPLLYGLNLILRDHSRTYQVLEQSYFLAQFELFIHELELKKPAVAEDRPAFPASRRRRIEEVYRHNLRDMILAAQAKGIPVVLISPAANLRDWPPLQSFHYSTLTPEALRAFKQNLEEGHQQLREREFQGSKVALQAALSIDPTYAEAQYLYAEAQASLEDWDGARQHYRLARDWDDRPERAPDGIIAIDLDLARATGSHFLELDQFLARASSSPIAGFDMFYDSVHFTYRGEYEVARALFQELTT